MEYRIYALPDDNRAVGQSSYMCSERYLYHQIIKPNIDSEASYQSAQSILVGLPLGEERSNTLAKLFSFGKGPSSLVMELRSIFRIRLRYGSRP